MPIPIRPRAHLAARASWTGLALLALLPLTGAVPPRIAEAASWRDLTGRMAPDLVFGEVQGEGLAPGTRISSFRNKSVVLLVFWVRDCPHCRRELPRVQRFYAENHRSGLQVISVVHSYPLAEIQQEMKSHGWEFPVARDPNGNLASPYGGGRRPASYVIGLDGRVKSSNSLSSTVINQELGRWRLKELGPVPPMLNEARNWVYRRDYGEALKEAERVAALAEATAEVRAAVARIARIAAEKLQNRVEEAERYFAKGQVRLARTEYRAMVQTFTGTSLAARAQTLHDQFEARAGTR